MTQTNYATSEAVGTAADNEYFAHQIAFAELPAKGTEASLARIELPAGNYLVEARAVFSCLLVQGLPPEDSFGFVICRLTAGTAQDKLRFTFARNQFVPPQHFESVRLGLAVNLSAGGAVEVFGNAIGPIASVVVEPLNLLARRIETLTVIPPPDPGGGGGGGEGDP
ncbi:MAG: hypothetical protein HY011_09060 [Acidobacteria bacterium]|nr:hypothetical protein [Acidobacteriota bacterium]